MVKAEKISRKYLRESKNTNIITALKECDFELRCGEITEITGRSGSGKSTLLNILAGLILPSGGNVYYDDVDIYFLNDKERSAFRNKNTGVIPQGHTGLKSLTVIENVLLPCMMYGDATGYEQRAKELLERMEIGHLEKAYPDELSGGELRRLSIARALIKEPDYIFADEPTGDLDDETTHIVFNLLREYANSNKAVLLVTHEKEAAEYADTIYKMCDGNLSK